MISCIALAWTFGVTTGRRRVGTHAAGVRTLVLVQQALVVLAGGQRDDVLAVAQHDEGGFLAFEELLDDNTGTACVVDDAELVVCQDPVDRLVRLGQRHRDDDALARRQAIGLDDDRRAVFLMLSVHITVSRSGIAEGLVGGGGDAMALHEVLGEGLGRFELRGRLGRAEDAQAAGAELVHHAGPPGRPPGRPRSGAIFSLAAKSASAFTSVIATFFKSASRAVPPLPGAT